MLKLYNSFSRKKETFKPLTKKEVRMYTCGLTVYNYGHIGNYRAFIVSDILRRYLEYKGYKVKKIVNITDVDDKTIKGSIQEGKSLEEFTKIYEQAFFEDEKKLNIKPASFYPKATSHIKEMVKLINNLLKKGVAYRADDGIYFNVRKFSDYGKLSGVNIEKLKVGGSERVRGDEYDKKNVKDFALWKFYDSEDGKIFWETKLGKGRPGWHIECSAMSTKYLGKNFDIHTGGIDLLFPHHENEIAQSESSFSKKFVNYWIHNEWLLVEGRKMSKSLGNYYTIRDIIKLDYNPLALRYFYLTGNYRSQLNFTLDSLKNAQISLERLRNIISEIKNDNRINKKYLKKFEFAMDDDLDSVSGLQVLWGLVRDKKAYGKIKAIKEIDRVFGLDLLKKEKIEVPDEIMKLIERREKTRKEKNWLLADNLREEIKKLGYKIDDSEEGSKVSRI